MYRHSTSEVTAFLTKNNDLTNFCVQSNIQSSEAFFSLIYIKNFPISATKQLFRWISPISVMNEKCRHDGKSLKIFVYENTFSEHVGESRNNFAVRQVGRYCDSKLQILAIFDIDCEQKFRISLKLRN